MPGGLWPALKRNRSRLLCVHARRLPFVQQSAKQQPRSIQISVTFGSRVGTALMQEDSARSAQLLRDFL